MQDLRWLVMLAVLLWGCTGSTTPGQMAPDVSSTTTTTLPGTTTSSAPATTQVDEDSELRMGTVTPVDSLDPADALTFGDWEILQAVNEGLLRREPGDGELIPGIAEDLPEVSDDGLTYTFHLRPEVAFADGTALTAPMYVASIERVMRLGGRSSDLVSLYVSSVEAPDDETVVFHLRDRFAFFPILVANAPYSPTHPDVYPEEELVPLPAAPINGVGPWTLVDYSESEIVLEPNPEYYGGPVGANRLVIRTFETPEEMASALVGGHIDFAWRGVDRQAAALLSDTEGVSVEVVPGGTLHFLTVNHGLAPTDDPIVRQAIAQLVDRETVVEEVLGGAFVPAFSPVPPGYAGSSDSFLETYGDPDISRAIDLLEEAGYTETNRAEIELAYPPERFGLEIAAAMEELELQIESTGLVEVTLTTQPWNTYVGDVIGGAYHLAFLGWLHDFPDTYNYLGPFVLAGGVGGSGDNLENPEMIDLLTEAGMTFDGSERSRLYGEVQSLFAEDVVTIPLWIDHPYIAYRDSVVASSQFDNPQSLNIGTTLLLDFRSIGVGPGDNG
jgi:peptide/nickel transport system substrate-binding protein